MRISFIFKSIIVTIIGVAVFLGATACSHTPNFRNIDRSMVENAIAEERMMLLGDVEQYVLIRGRDRDAPLLVFLHGGPGTSAMPFNRVFNSELEDEFVFVNWDQRGTGKSFSAQTNPANLTLDRMTRDLDELVDALRAEFDKEQVLLIGHSWGSMLGLEYVSRHPEKVAAYIGIGQMADTAASETEGYDWLLARVTELGDDTAIARLEEIGPPPYSNGDEMMAQRQLLNKFGGAWIEPKSDINYALIMLKAPEFTWTDIRAVLSGADISLNTLYETFTSLNAIETYPVLDVPVFLMEGRHDHVVSPVQAVKYLDAVIAPHKELIWFENSAHTLQVEEADRYNAEVLRIARQVGILQ